MRDSLGRNINYLRISVTDRCNLRCIYCMPDEGVEWVAHENILSFEEITRLCRVMAALGVQRIRLTGGEPLVRLHLPRLIADLKAIDGIEQVSLTTNGILFAPMCQELQNAGLDGVNFSLDTLKSDVFFKITRRDQFSDVMRGLNAALDGNFSSIKVNCVPVRGINDGEIADLAALSKSNPLDVRFIEMMPIGLGKQFQAVPMECVQNTLVSAFGTPEHTTGQLGNGPAVYCRFPGFVGHVGYISALTHEFCGQCNRVRLTAEGFLKLCLHYSSGIDLRTPLRAGETDETLRAQVAAAILEKPEHHCFAAAYDNALEEKNMNAIGG